MFKDFLTTEGERLLAKSIAGTATITFTKMEIGDGDRGTSTKAITSLQSPKMTLDLYSVLISGDNNIEITTILDSSAIPDGFYFREKGIYATDGTTEILFMYSTSGSLAEWIENIGNAVFTRTIRTIITLSDSDNVQITIQKGTYASGQDAENILAAIQSIELDGDWAKYSQAESILSILDTFVAAYTVARAGKLDNLDVLLSSRAPASTALSNATWTNTRAAAIDTINTNAARLTAARAGYLDYLANATYGLPAIQAYVDTLESVIGATANTGGTASTGTVMAKLNTLLTNITASRAANLDKIGTTGDFVGKTYFFEQASASGDENVVVTVKSYTNSKGGIIRFNAVAEQTYSSDFDGYVTLIVDGVTICSQIRGHELGCYGPISGNSLNVHWVDIPFKETFILQMISSPNHTATTVYKARYVANIHYYINP